MKPEKPSVHFIGAFGPEYPIFNLQFSIFRGLYYLNPLSPPILSTLHQLSIF